MYYYTGGMLTGKEIQRQIDLGNIVIDPYNPNQLNPNSYNLRLSNKLLTYRKLIGNNTDVHCSIPHILDMDEESVCYEIEIPENGYILYPGILYLGSTIESTFTDKFIPMIEGRSSVGRLGIDIHKTAGFGDIGFNGKWTLEIVATEPVKIYPGREICQISYHTPYGDTSMQYSGRYNNQEEPVISRFYLDKSKEK